MDADPDPAMHADRAAPTPPLGYTHAYPIGNGFGYVNPVTCSTTSNGYVYASYRNPNATRPDPPAEHGAGAAVRDRRRAVTWDSPVLVGLAMTALGLGIVILWFVIIGELVGLWRQWR